MSFECSTVIYRNEAAQMSTKISPFYKLESIEISYHNSNIFLESLSIIALLLLFRNTVVLEAGTGFPTFFRSLQHSGLLFHIPSFYIAP